MTNQKQVDREKVARVLKGAEKRLRRMEKRRSSRGVKQIYRAAAQRIHGLIG